MAGGANLQRAHGLLTLVDSVIMGYNVKQMLGYHVQECETSLLPVKSTAQRLVRFYTGSRSPLYRHRMTDLTVERFSVRRLHLCQSWERAVILDSKVDCRGRLLGFPGGLTASCFQRAVRWLRRYRGRTGRALQTRYDCSCGTGEYLRRWWRRRTVCPSVRVCRSRR